MPSSLQVCLAAATLGAFASAQEFIGFNYNVQVGATSRGSLNVNPGEVMVRIDGSEYAGWGTDTPGMRTISSIYTIVQDQDAVATPEVWDIVLYPEDPLVPGNPDLASPIPFAQALAGPAAPAAGIIAAAAATVTPNTPVAVPIQGGGDIFVSFVLPAAAGWPNDGLSVQITLGYAPSVNFTVFDHPGQAQNPFSTPDATNSHSLTVSSVGGIPSYNTRRAQVIDIEHSTAAGVVLGITNQASLLGSANPPPANFGPAPGTADFMSGVAPDVSLFDPLRADDVTMDYFRTGSGAPLVFFLLDIGPSFNPELPLTALGAPVGSTGVGCVNPSTFLNAGLVIGNADEAFLTITFPAAVRSGLVGFQLTQQAMEFDTTNLVLHSSPCGTQVF